MKTCLTVLLAFLSVNVIAQQKGEATLSGTCLQFAGRRISIKNAEHYSQTVRVDKTGAFTITLNTDTAYYDLMFGRNAYVLYVEPGMNMVITKTDSDIVFSGKGSFENNLIKQLSADGNKYLPLDKAGLLSDGGNSIEPDDFIQHFYSYKNYVASALKQESNKSYFVKTQKDCFDYKCRYLADMYFRNYQVDPDDRKEVKNKIADIKEGDTKQNPKKLAALYKTYHVRNLSDAQRVKIRSMIWGDFDMNNAELFKCSKLYARMLSDKVTLIVHDELNAQPALRAENINELKFNVVKDDIKNSFIKQNLLYTYAVVLLNTGIDADRYFSDYMDEATDEVDIADVRAVYNNVKKTANDNSSTQLEYADLDKIKAILATLKGNYVYVNVWAEYSDPGKAEIPYLAQLEQKYQKENIRFMSISVDRFADFRKWKRYVTENKLSGLQVINDNNPNADFMKEYHISTIPRFILIDPKGNVVSSNAVKPSNPELQKQLDKLLNVQM